MSTKNDTSWMPPKGSYPVSIGSSLGAALRANKGLPQAPKLSDRGFFSFRYNFKPESIDLYKPGTIEVKREGERKTATIERASTVPGEGQLFTGAETTAKDVDCVLVYDEEHGTFTLEKLDSYINVTWGGKSAMPSNRPSESPAPAAPSAPVSPVKKEDPEDLEAALERELYETVDTAPPKPKRSLKQESSSHRTKASTSSTPNGTSGAPATSKKPPVKRDKIKPREPPQMFMNPNSAAARIANSKKSAVVKQEPKAEEKLPVLPQPSQVSKVAKLAGNLKKGVKREPDRPSEEYSRVQKRPKPSPSSSKTQPQSKLQTSKPPPLTAGLPPKPQTALVPPRPQPTPKPQPPVKKEFSLALPTGSSSGSSSTKNPLFAGGSGETSQSLPTGLSTLGGTQPSHSTFAVPTGHSDSESDWDEVEADGPSPSTYQTQPQSEPQPYSLGSLVIEEDPPAGFSAKLDIVEGDEGGYDDDEDDDAEGDEDMEEVDIDMADLMAEMDEQLQDGDGGEQEGEGDPNDLNEVDDWLIGAIQPEPADQSQEGYQDPLYDVDDSSSSSDDSDY